MSAYAICQGMKSLPVLLFLAASTTASLQAQDNVFPARRLPNLGTNLARPLNSCPSRLCLTVYLSPNCGYCRQAAELFRKLRLELRPKKITVRFIIGSGTEPDIRAFAAEFGPDTMLDLNGELRVQGYPLLWLSNKKGAIIRSQFGAPPNLAAAVKWALAP